MANGNSKSRKKKIIIFSILGVVVIALVVLVIVGSNKETITTVQTETVGRRTITQIVSATGKIQPETQVVINAEVSGEIIDLPVREGQRVRKGQLLVKIKPDAYQAQYERALASMAINEANLQKAEAEFKRVSELHGKQLVSQAEMDIARASYQSAKAGFDQSQASVKEARETLSKTSIYSPMDGVVSSLPMELGERVSGSTFTRGTEIMTVADLARMEARVDVGENDIVTVSVGDTARIEIDAFPERKFIGIVSQIANTAKSTGLGSQDQVTNFEVRILVDTPPGVQLRPGMSMTADIETDTKANVMSIPIQSVTVRMPKEDKEKPEEEGEEGGAKFVSSNSEKKKEEEKLDEVVFVVKDGQVSTVKVKRGLSDDSHVEVTGEGLEGAEIVSGPFKAINRDLEAGSKVKVDNKRGRRTGASAATAS
ncbi:MAG: efflux RND transporter periplasmic adaptor subunit [Bacteroidetes bacterium]|jgi:HlyD family secretion protein|nr:efflux RND transporter periplasmic adaptor subunit [Bacteroidota bacterium]